VFVNYRLCSLFGYPRDELLALSPLDPVAPEERQRIASVMDEMMRTGLPPRELEYWIVRKDGTRRCINNRYTPRVVDGSMTGCIIVTTDVTERRRAEDATVQSERLFRTIVEGSPVPMTVSADDGTIMYANESFGALVGWTADSLVGRSLDGLLGSPVAGRRTFASGEVLLKCSDDRTVWVAATLRRMDLGAGAIVLGGYVDIDTRKSVDEARRLQNDLMAFLATAPGLPAFYRRVVDTATSLSAGSAGLLVRCGDDDRRPEVLAHGGLADDVLDAFVEQAPVVSDQVHARGPCCGHPSDLPTRGTFFSMVRATSLCLLPMRWVDGTRVCLVVYGTDGQPVPPSARHRLAAFAELVVPLIARSQAEEALRRSDERHRSLLRALPDTLVRLERSGRFLDCHAPDGDGLFDAKAAVGRHIVDVLPPALADDLALAIERVFTEATVEIFDHRWSRGSDQRTAEFRISRGSDHEVTVLIRDVTSLRQVESERQGFERSLLQRQHLESLGVLAGGLAHEFNNLLQAIRGNATMAADDAPAGSPLREAIDEIDEAACRAADLTSQMLAYGGKGRFVVRPLSVSATIEGLEALVAASLPKRATVRYSLPPDLPLVDGDEQQLGQLVMNLITNAAEALDSSGGSIAVTATVVNADRTFLDDFSYHATPPLPGCYVCLTVDDDGCGIEATHLPHLFEPFFSTKFTGRGLGLPAVLGIVRGHGGALALRTEVGVGTSVRVLLPARPTDVDEPRPAATTAATWRGTGTILVVDDDPAIRRIAARILERAGFDVEAAVDGLAAIELLDQRAVPPDLVLLDMTMPRMDGAETFRRLKERYPDVPVILVSGYDEQEATRTLAGTGLAGFLHKPFGRTALLESIRRALDAPP